MPVPHGYKPLAKSERPLAHGGRRLAPLDAHEQLSITFVLRTRPDGRPLPDFHDWQRTPLSRRRRLSVAEFTRIHGAHPGDLATVAAFATSHGMSVLERDAASATLVARGTVAQMNAAFGITLCRCESPLHTPRERRLHHGHDGRRRAPTTQHHRGFDGPVHLPPELDGVVTAVFGLDNRILGGVNGSGDPPGSTQLSVPTIAQLYNFPTTGAANQTIGIFNGGGNYDPADIANYIAGLPSGYTSAPNVTEVDLTVDGTTYKNDKTKVTSPSNADYEITQDIETAATIAQGATIAVYCTVSNEDGWLAFLKAALFPAAGQPAPSVLSSSWFISAADDESSVGSGVQDTLSAQFAKAAPLGISIFIALGDSGADSGITDGKCHVQYPGSDPWITSVGGTVIGNIVAGPPTTFDEWVWSEEPTSGATDGGVSDYFPQPAYQSDAGVNAKSKNDNKVRRGVPDIAGNSAAASAYSGLLIGGSGFSYYGTSCAAPLYAGLAAALNQALGEPIGFLNPTLYAFGASVCNDVTTGNNDSNDGSGAPYYSAATGWDSCTGWGSINGNALLQVFQALFKKKCEFVIDETTYGQDEVELQLPGVASFAAGWVEVDGFRPSELFTGGNLNSPVAVPSFSTTLDPSLPPAVASAIQGMLVAPAFAGPVLPLDSSLPNEPQGFLFPFTIGFNSDSGFLAMRGASPAITSTFVTLGTQIVVGSNTLENTGTIELTTGEDPRFVDVNPKNPTQYPFWLSFDLRFFKMVVPPGGNASRFNATMTTNWQDAPGFIAQVIKNLDSGNTAGDTFDPGLSQDEETSALEFQQKDNSGNFVFNFAVARVRLLAKSAATARTVRVFFRLFQAQNTVSDFNTSATSGTYRFASDGTTYGHKIPLLGTQTDAGGNLEYVTIPCFATERIVLSDPTKSMADQQDTPNARDLATNPGGEADYYFGCWLDVNQPQLNVIPSSPPAGNLDGPWPAGILGPIQAAMNLFPHQCLIAEIRFDDTPVPSGATTSTSDKLAQRNIAWLDGPNPGLAASRRMMHPVQVRPTPKASVNPDELMILWGNTPPASTAQLYLPALDAAAILKLADARYSDHRLQVVDAHTIGCPTGGATLIPLPEGTALAAGLLSIDLPSGIRKGDVYSIAVRQITDATARALPPPPPPPRLAGHLLSAAAAAVATPKLMRWRRVAGAFQFVLTISTKERLLLSEERLLAVMRWILEQTPKQKRWHPVLVRYIDDIVGRVQGFGGDPGTIKPSPTGDVPGLHKPIHPPHHAGEAEEVTGKIVSLIYDHFGDFAGFVLETERDRHHRFESREPAVRDLANRAWLERIRVTVLAEPDRRHIPRMLMLHAGGGRLFSG
jgi:hypothetical protein